MPTLSRRAFLVASAVTASTMCRTSAANSSGVLPIWHIVLPTGQSLGQHGSVFDVSQVKSVVVTATREPLSAAATPASVRVLGRRRVVAHTQPTTSRGAAYSSSSATPTGR